MKIVQVALILFVIFLSVHCKNHCPTSYCGNNNTIPIQYPFKLEHEYPVRNCNYTNLTCSSQGIPILNLPYLGDFYVRHIYYDYSVIEIYDPENCLPNRFMNSNPDVYPFLAALYQNYTFYSCPLELAMLANLTYIDCLSNSSFATVATNTVSSKVMTELYRCNEIVTSSVPVLKPRMYGFIENQNHFFLQWSAPPCNVCPQKGGILIEGLLSIALLMLNVVMLVIMPALICIACCATCTKTLREEMKVKRRNNLA